MEFQPGDQKNGMRAPGGWTGAPSMENASAESGSSGGLGSETLIFTNVAVRPLSRCGERAILAPEIRKAADGAAQRAAASSGTARAIAASTSSRLFQSFGFSQRQLEETSFCGTNTWKNL